MKITKYLSVGIAALATVSTVKADTVIHITGSTAFRAATIAAIENVMGGAGNFKAAYAGTSGGEAAATYVVLQGNVASAPAAGLVTVKCAWAGSTGGIKTVVQNLDITGSAPNGWMSISNLPGTNTVAAVASPSYALDTVAFPGENLKADVTMQDSLQASTGFTSTTLTETKVGIIAFEWVANNGAPATLDNITPLLAQAMLSGGVPLSQFTANPAQSGTPVYAAGRDFDSGTRLSCLAETGIGVFGGVQHIFPIVTGGNAGAVGSSVTGLKLWPAANILNQAFAIGQSGFASGGTLADNLATPGTSTAATSGGSILPEEELLFGPGWLVAYLGRNDASRACRTSVIAGNTAHRLRWNGVADWNGPILASGAPTSFNDAVIQEGLYSLWEYEWLSYRSTYGTTSPNGKAVADKIAQNITTTTATVSGISDSALTMHVSRPFEGGLITLR